jgi:holo-[acyl-carrier protein] synthase
MTAVAHGLDIVMIDRIARMLAEHGDRFPSRCFTESERGYAEAGGTRRIERYAARFACKEAVLKALGTGWRSGISWQDIEILREPSGQPAIKLTGRSAELAAQLGIRRWLVSLTHTSHSAAASVVALA